MSKILEGMARASLRIKTQEGFDRSTEHAKVGEIVGMRDALLWLASNVSDEMVQEANERFNRTLWADTEAGRKSLFKLLVETALRAAAGGGE